MTPGTHSNTRLGPPQPVGGPGTGWGAYIYTRPRRVPRGGVGGGGWGAGAPAKKPMIAWVRAGLEGGILAGPANWSDWSDQAGRLPAAWS
jgi:hypothetical protein